MQKKVYQMANLLGATKLKIKLRFYLERLVRRQ